MIEAILLSGSGI
ncbi:hypothetical protein VCHC50A1_1754, partial [Vibrio cholerae HC-50A1]